MPAFAGFRALYRSSECGSGKPSVFDRALLRFRVLTGYWQVPKRRCPLHDCKEPARLLIIFTSRFLCRTHKPPLIGSIQPQGAKASTARRFIALGWRRQLSNPAQSVFRVEPSWQVRHHIALSNGFHSEGAFSRQ
jgi:hypothetical protein